MARRKLDMTFGEIVKSKRLSLDITQDKFSELVGISSVYCRDIESGKSRPSWVICAKICLVLDIDLNKIVEYYIKPELNDIGKLLGISI